jgi:6-phosphogluconolactonase
VVAADAGLEPFVPRVTLTLPPITAALDVVFLVAGADKAEAVERAFAQPPSRDTPASLARGKRTVAYLDAAAAARLPR